MKTDDLIVMLAQGAGATEPAGDARRMVLGAALALPVMVAAVALTLGLVPMSDWPVSATVPKLCYALVLMVVGALLLRRAGRPASGVALPLALLVGVLLAAAVIGTGDLLRQPAAGWRMQILGKSALICPFAILALSVPALAGMLWAERQLAPVHLRLAGAAAGLAAGGLAAVAYTLGCTEGSLTFVSIWYTGGVALATAFGALIGPRVLRW